jgi:hypothetical protein
MKKTSVYLLGNGINQNPQNKNIDGKREKVNFISIASWCLSLFSDTLKNYSRNTHQLKKHQNKSPYNTK